MLQVPRGIGNSLDRICSNKPSDSNSETAEPRATPTAGSAGFKPLELSKSALTNSWRSQRGTN